MFLFPTPDIMPGSYYYKSFMTKRKKIVIGIIIAIVAIPAVQIFIAAILIGIMFLGSVTSKPEV